MAEVEEKEEGNPDRIYLGIDGTMADAQDKEHPYLKSVYGDWCRICGLSPKFRNHCT